MTSALERSLALEEACDFEGAARAALEAGEPRRAMRLAALSGEGETIEAATEALAALGPRGLELAAAELVDRGHPLPAASLYLRAGDRERAAACFATGGDARRAAAAYEQAGQPAAAARALEQAIRANDDDELRLALAELCERHGRFEAAAKAVQAMALDGEARKRGLGVLARSLRALGFREAAREAEREASAAGVAVAPEQPAASAVDGAGTESDAPLFGRFEPRRSVAESPHARVLEVLDRMTGRPVALKLLRAQARGAGRDAMLRFEREARALARLAHPTIVGLVEYLADGPALALEWMPGGDLTQLLQRESFAPARAAEITAAVLGALGEAHRLGILHRDVKPSNVLFDAVGAPRLSDFGAAHVSDESSTATAGAIGTFAYMSPEQRAGRPATVASDLYGAGALLYQMLTGEQPEPSREGALDPPPSACHPDLDERHDAFVASLLAERPEARPEGALAARRALEALPWSSRVVPREQPPASRRSGRPAPGETAGRFGPPADPGDGRDPGRSFDRATARDLLRLPLDDAELARARAFAAASPRHVALVLRALPDDGELWVERPRGRALVDVGARLTPSQASTLRGALASLHAADGIHGAIDAEHVYVDEDGAPFLAWPRRAAPAGCSPADDLAALDALS